MKVSNEILIESYNRLQSVWLVAEEVGLCGQSVHERLVKLKAIVPMNYFSDEDKGRLKKDYMRYLIAGKLEELATEMKRTKQFICRQAKKLGLTNIGRKKKDLKNFVPFIKSGHWDKYEHPRGMKGLQHSDMTKAIISEKSIKSQKEITESGRRGEISKKILNTRFNSGTYSPERQKTTWKSGWRQIGDVLKYFRSRWEANYARYLQHLKEQNLIIDWKHEPKLFWFKVKGKETSYLPDFKVILLSNEVQYREVKGWMDERSITKIQGFIANNPLIRLSVIQADWFKGNSKQMAQLIKDWE